MVAVDAEARSDGTRRGDSGVTVFRASAIEPEWLLDLYPERLRETSEYLWNAAGERVELAQRLTYDQLVLDEKSGRPGADADGSRVAAVLAEAALGRGARAFADGEALDQLVGRVAFVRERFAEAGLPALGAAEIDETLRALCHGRSSFEELHQASLVDAASERLLPKARQALAELAPPRVTLPGGRSVRVTYAPGQPPSIASRLQDFFGMSAGPTVGRGRVPLVLHLLAPNQRAVQVTSDLAGFWERTYPSVRRELCRRYPRHAWPEDPRSGPPTRRRT
jgi:ATP-dependent helicase HrpB